MKIYFQQLLLSGKSFFYTFLFLLPCDDQNNPLECEAVFPFSVQLVLFWLKIYPIITPFDAFEISYIFEDIMENGAFAPSEQMLHFSIIFTKAFKTLLKLFFIFSICLKIENDVMI